MKLDLKKVKSNKKKPSSISPSMDKVGQMIMAGKK